MYNKLRKQKEVIKKMYINQINKVKTNEEHKIQK